MPLKITKNVQDQYVHTNKHKIKNKPLPQIKSTGQHYLSIFSSLQTVFALNMALPLRRPSLTNSKWPLALRVRR